MPRANFLMVTECSVTGIAVCTNMMIGQHSSSLSASRAPRSICKCHPEYCNKNLETTCSLWIHPYWKESFPWEFGNEDGMPNVNQWWFITEGKKNNAQCTGRGLGALASWKYLLFNNCLITEVQWVIRETPETRVMEGKDKKKQQNLSVVLF